MIWPIEADMLVGLVDTGNMAAARIFWVICFLIVFYPFILSCRRMRRYPGRWCGLEYLIATGIILTLNIASGVWLFFYKPAR